MQREESCTHHKAIPLVAKMPSISDIALGGYAVVATGLTVLVMAFDACNLVPCRRSGAGGLEGRVLRDECAMMKAAPRGDGR